MELDPVNGIGRSQSEITPELNESSGELANLVLKEDLVQATPLNKAGNNILEGFQRTAANTAEIGKFILGEVKTVGTKIKSRIKTLTSRDTPKVSFQKAMPLDLHFSKAAQDIRKHLLNPKHSPEEKALFIYKTSNDLLGTMANRDAKVAQGGADLSQEVTARLASELIKDNVKEVRKELAKAADAVDEVKLMHALREGTMIEDSKVVMRLALEQQKNAGLETEETLKRRHQQLDALDETDLAPNVMSRLQEINGLVHQGSG